MPLSFKAGEHDLLTEILNSVRLQGRIFSSSELSAPWSLELPPTGNAYFHVIERGGGWLRLKGEETATRLSSGDLVVLPHGQGHFIGDHPRTPPLTLDEFLRLTDEQGQPKWSGNGTLTRLICGSFHFEDMVNNPLLKLLPTVLCIRGGQGRAEDWLESTLRHLAYEARNSKAGSQIMVTRLTDLIFVQAVRAWLGEQPENKGGWLGALKDKQIGAALSLMHREPNRDWSVAALAAEVAMSRSKFAEKFKSLVGETPLAYLTRWRMRLAASFLSDPNLSIGEIAGRVGYESEPSFSQAFKRQYGVPPSMYRRGIEKPS
jgi:AraC family transcriptional regulator, alkane utilization regulator